MAEQHREQSGSSTPFPEKKDSKPAGNRSENQADGTAADRPRGETQAHAAQFNKGLADDTGSGKVKSSSPEKRTAAKIDPSSPTNSTEGGTTSMPQNPTMDSAGEIGEPTGKGNMSMKDDTMNNQQNKEQGNKDKDKNQQGNQASQQNKQGGQQAQGQNQGQQNLSGRSDRQENQSGQQDKQGQQSGSSHGSQQSSQNQGSQQDRQSQGSQSSGNTGQGGNQSSQNQGSQSDRQGQQSGEGKGAASQGVEQNKQKDERKAG